MRPKAAFALSVCVLLGSIAVFAGEWQELKSEHFIVYYLYDDNFAGEVSREAEKYYDRIASDLGYPRYDNFWTWDNRARIYIYRDRNSFLQATGAVDWSYGFAVYDKRTIVSYANNAKFIEALLPHEVTHLIFRDFVGFKGQIPAWLDEGVAQWEEFDKRKAAVESVRESIANKTAIPLSALTQTDISREGNAEISRKFYAESVTLVGFLIEKYGQSKFTLFCRQLRDGASINEALKFTYSDSIRDMDELEKEWIKYYGG
jgi:hypothetical protein